MIYITGDTHGKFDRIADFCNAHHTSRDDVMIILGDVGLNYYGNKRDTRAKEFVSSLPMTFFCIHGNHEERPQNVDGYMLTLFHNGLVLKQNEYPNILFAVDSQTYDFNGKKSIVIGGAYSVDKFYRLSNGYRWFQSEQPDEKTKHIFEYSLFNEHNGQIDVILSHTCPFRYIPREMFLPSVDQSTVDTSTEEWLDKIEQGCQYGQWYCGHYHTNKHIDRIHFLFEDIIEFEWE